MNLGDRYAVQMSRQPSGWSRYLNVRVISGALLLLFIVAAVCVGIYKIFAALAQARQEPPTFVTTEMMQQPVATKTENQQDEAVVRAQPEMPVAHAKRFVKPEEMDGPVEAPQVKAPKEQAKPVAARDFSNYNAFRKLSVIEQNMSDYIARCYKVPGNFADHVVVEAVRAGKSLGLDPILILSVSAVESAFNPFAQSSVGAQGLMQVHTKVHKKLFDEVGEDATPFDTRTNFAVGGNILVRYIKRTGGIVPALRWYVGAANRMTDDGYGRRVLTERSRLMIAAGGQIDHARSLLLRGGFGDAYWQSRKAKNLPYSGYASFVKSLENRKKKKNKAATKKTNS